MRAAYGFFKAGPFDYPSDASIRAFYNYCDFLTFSFSLCKIKLKLLSFAMLVGLENE
jgi:hypothetical protein